MSPASDLYGNLRDKKKSRFLPSPRDLFFLMFCSQPWLFVAGCLRCVWDYNRPGAERETLRAYTYSTYRARFITDPPFSRTSSSCVLPQVAVVGLFHLKDEAVI
jgi:hypothetical protein